MKEEEKKEKKAILQKVKALSGPIWLRLKYKYKYKCNYTIGRDEIGWKLLN